MPKIQQHIPNFARDPRPGDPPLPEEEFNTLEDLQEVDFVKRWTDSKNFSHFELAHPNLHTSLIAVMKDDSYWVVGHLSELNDELSSLTVWEYDNHKHREKPKIEIENFDSKIRYVFDDVFKNIF